MNEELLKRYTDCVYFLASPLTCKKGIECEYRHNEMARLNPRECWYWLSGSCLNPACAFRHPPLDGHTGETLEPAPSSVPVNKTNVRCYYYFNGYCNKGDRCSFLHDMESEPPQGRKVAKTSINSKALHSENNALAGTNGHLNPPTTTLEEVEAKDQPKEDFQVPVSKDIRCRSSSLVSEAEETVPIRPYSLPPVAGFVDQMSYARENRGSEELVSDQIDEEDIYPDEIDKEDIYADEIDGELIKPEERWESSPGFDVLVDGEAYNLDSEDGQEYIMALDGTRGDMNGHFQGYDFETPVKYDRNNPDMECHYTSEVYCRPEDDFGDMKTNVAGRSRVRMYDDSISHHERNLMSPELGFDDPRGSDLRYYLSRRRCIDNQSFSGLTRIHESSRLIGRGRDRPWPRGIHHRQRRERLTSERRYIVKSLVKNGMFSYGGRRNGFPRQISKQLLSKKQSKEERRAKRPRLLSEVSRETRPTHEAFSGPKTLAQIKEEKMKAQENGDFTGTIGYYSKTTSSSTDFKSPRPLSEILKEKGKLG